MNLPTFSDKSSSPNRFLKIVLLVLTIYAHVRQSLSKIESFRSLVMAPQLQNDLSQVREPALNPIANALGQSFMSLKSLPVEFTRFWTPCDV